MRLKRREGEGRDRAPVVFIGRAVVRAFDIQAVIGDVAAVAKIRERMSVGIDERKINIRDANIVDALLVQEKFGLKQHGDFLLCAVDSVQRDFEAVASRIADRRFPHKLKRHGIPHGSYAFLHFTTFAVNNR